MVGRISKAICLFAIGWGAVAIAAQPASAAQKRPPQNQVKGQKQLSGGSGVFGTVYTLQNGFNFEILSAKYTVEPFAGPYMEFAKPDEKLLVLDIAIKNSQPRDNSFNGEHFFNFVDDKGQIYHSGNITLDSTGRNGINGVLRPGQGLGQPALKDPLRASVELPARARIVKIMLREGRAVPKDDTFRYYIAGATKEEAGEAGNPKNVIAPLPEDVRDPADPSGSTPLAEGKGATGVYVPSYFYALRLDSFASTTDPVTGSAPASGKRYAVATVTAKCLDKVGRAEFFDIDDANVDQLTDSDGERYNADTFLKAKRPEKADHNFLQGEEYTFRIVFALPADAKAKKLVLGSREGRKWAYDVSTAP